MFYLQNEWTEAEAVKSPLPGISWCNNSTDLHYLRLEGIFLQFQQREREREGLNNASLNYK